MRLGSCLIAILLFSTCSFAQTGAGAGSSWISVGPDGGDVRTLSADPANPQRILLGTSAGQIYQSEDAGRTWQRFVRIGKGNDYVVDHIIFDPKQPAFNYTIQKDQSVTFRYRVILFSHAADAVEMNREADTFAAEYK